MDKVSELALEEYKGTGIDIQPMFPAVLVRVLDKALQTSSGLLWLPETSKDGNTKTLYEGIVIRAYKPVRRVIEGKEVLLDSGLQTGDQVLFPHWSGEPAPFLSDQEYRLVPHRGILSTAGSKDSGEIVGIIHRSVALEAVYLQTLLVQASVDCDISSNVEEFLKEYEVIRKISTSSVTY